MKCLILLFKVLGVLMALISLLSFGSDFLPVGGINISGWNNASDENMFFKVIPSDSADPRLTAIMFALLSIGCFVLVAGIKKVFNVKMANNKFDSHSL